MKMSFPGVHAVNLNIPFVHALAYALPMPAPKSAPNAMALLPRVLLYKAPVIPP